MTLDNASMLMYNISMKECTKCHEEKDESEFPPSPNTKDGYYHWCRPCKNKEERERRQRNAKLKDPSQNKSMWSRAQQRAGDGGLDFTITPDNIFVPQRCPVFGTMLEVGGECKDNSPSLDRIDNTKGYVPGNVVVVSYKANRLKNNASLEELKQLVEYYEHLDYLLNP